MAEHLASGFELLEERLRLLEKVGLSHADPPAIAGRPATDHSLNETPNPDSPNTSLDYGSEDLLSRTAGLAHRQVGPSAIDSGWDDRYKGGIQECRDELTVLVEEAVGDSDRRQRLIVEQIVARFMIEAEGSFKKSARMISSRAIQLVGQQIQIAAESGLHAGPTDIKPSAGSAETQRPEASDGKPPGRGCRRVADHEVTAATGAGRQTPADLGFGAHFRAALQAFEEDSAKLIAANLHKTMRELLERELRAHRRVDGTPHLLDAADSCAPRKRTTGETPLRSYEAICVPAPGALGNSKPEKSSSGVADPRGVKDLHEAKEHPRKQKTWRILGLS